MLKLFSVFAILAVSFGAVPAYAEDDFDMSVPDIMQAFHDANQEEIQTSVEMWKKVNDALSTTLPQELTDMHLKIEESRRKDESGASPFYYKMLLFLGAQPIDQLGTVEAEKQLNSIQYGTSAGHPTQENAGYSASGNSDVNADASGSPVSRDEKLFRVFTSLFCNVEFTDRPAACNADPNRPNQNFTDIFLSQGSWLNAKVLAGQQLARRSFGTTEKFTFANDAGDVLNFVADQAHIARNNFRMAVMNALAARRAPTSGSTQEILGLVLNTLAPTGAISSTDYKRVCSKPIDQQRGPEVYACSFASEETDATTHDRVISQAAVDKIAQYDFYLSGEFYKTINSPAYSSRGSIERLEASMKAQQLAQDYQQLRLLQMKVAAAAVNVMN